MISDDYYLSETFTTPFYKLSVDGTKNIEKEVVRFRISQIDRRAHDNGSVGKSNLVCLEFRNPKFSWTNSIRLGNARYCGMATIYDVDDFDASVYPHKTTVRQHGKHILALMRGSENKVREIKKACSAFAHCSLVYENNILSFVNSKGEHKRMFRQVEAYIPIVELKNKEKVIDLKEYGKVVDHCIEWLEKHKEEWLDTSPKQKKSSVKRNRDQYTLANSIDYMAKNTVRWGNPVFIDTTEKQSVTFDVIKQKLRVVIEFWDSLSDLQKKNALSNININQPNELFDPSKMGLAGSGTEPPQATWFLFIEAFYKAVDIGLIYTDYQEPTIEPLVDEPQEVIEPVDTSLAHNSTLKSQSVLASDPIDLLSEELASTGFFDDVNDREEIKRHIVWRRGQPEFRRKLLEAYKGRCVITGCSSEEALEAAHIEPYSKTKNNNPTNGILLRADIHTLFDCDLIGIDPDTMKVCVAPNLVDYHKDFNDKLLQLPEHLHLDIEALRIRYKEYQERLGRYGKQIIANDESDHKRKY